MTTSQIRAELDRLAAQYVPGRIRDAFKADALALIIRAVQDDKPPRVEPTIDMRTFANEIVRPRV